MNYIKRGVNQLLNYIDNGTFFREPMKMYYILNGILAFIFPMLYGFFLFREWDYKIGSEVSWTSFTFGIGAILVLVWLLILAYCWLVYWLNRKDDLCTKVRKGDSITAIPVVAHYIQCIGESTGIFLALAPLGGYAILYIFCFLNGFTSLTGTFEFGEFLEHAIGGVLLFAVLVFIAFLVCYPIILLSHLIGEKLIMKAQVANDLRDVSDIHRAAIMEEEVSPIVENDKNAEK